MGPTMAGLDKLLRLPSGCGEQTMVSFAPDVFIYSYLKSTNQNNPTIMQKALDFMNKGKITYWCGINRYLVCDDINTDLVMKIHRPSSHRASAYCFLHASEW